MMSPYPLTRRTALIVVGLALVLTGCSAQAGVIEQVSPAELVEKVTAELTEQVGRAPDKIECPDALPAEKGAAVRCTLTDAGVSYGVSDTAREVGDDVTVGIEVDTEPLPEGDGS